jgi:glutathione S-transferase
MIDLHYAPTPNGWKISIMLEETGLPYTVFPIDIRAGDQFKPDFLAISPNNRIPAIVDHAPPDGGGPFSVFETGAILIYLADKTCRFMPGDMRGRSNVTQWLMWQMSGLGPMLGQHGHFALYASEKIPYAIERYRDEAARLYCVLDTQLGKTGGYVAGDYFDRRHRLLSLDHDPQGAGVHARRLPEHQALVCRDPRTAAGAGRARDRQVREKAVRRRGAKEHVRAEGEGAGGEEITSRHSGPAPSGASSDVQLHIGE